MITYTTGNLLESRAEALINTVNTVGVMGKGIALMFKERFPENFKRYSDACKAKTLKVGKVFATETSELDGPRWIVNFPTKQHWRGDSKIEWIEAGLVDLREFLVEHNIRSVAIPPLGSGNGGLEWPLVRALIAQTLSDIDSIDITVYEPTQQYQNVAKRSGVEKLTPARALIVELVRRYSVLGLECSLLEIQKLAWFLEQAIENLAPQNPLKLEFVAHKFGPYTNRLSHLLNSLDGSYLHCDKRISDASPFDVIWFDESRKDFLSAYLKSSDARPYLEALEYTARIIDGFESPYGLELLATTDWLISKEGIDADVQAIRQGLHHWPAEADRKVSIFDDRSIGIALDRLNENRSALHATQH